VGFGTGPGSTAIGAGSHEPSFTLHAVGTIDHTVNVPADGGGDGRPAILLFFASWCSACHAEVPAIASLYQHQVASHSRLAGVAVIGVDGQDATAAAFVHASGVTFPVATDATFTVTETDFAFNQLPEAVFVQSDGTIAKIHYGALSTATFVSWEKRLLAA
jgi:thiol-disulfide isomerase/thioredoxin